MLFRCTKNCYDNQRFKGYFFQDVYDLDEAEIEVMKSNGLFPTYFEPVSYEASQYLKQEPGSQEEEKKRGRK